MGPTLSYDARNENLNYDMGKANLQKGWTASICHYFSGMLLSYTIFVIPFLGLLYDTTWYV